MLSSVLRLLAKDFCVKCSTLSIIFLNDNKLYGINTCNVMSVYKTCDYRIRSLRYLNICVSLWVISAYSLFSENLGGVGT